MAALSKVGRRDAETVEEKGRREKKGMNSFLSPRSSSVAVQRWDA